MTRDAHKRRRRQAQGRPAIELLDEAAHLLRLAPLTTHLWYFAGSAPFVIGLLYFWADMTRSAYAARHAAAAALGVALLFTVMKTAQSVFCARLLAQAAGAPPPRLGVSGLWRVWLEQAAIQPWAIPIMGVAAVMTLPLPWAMAFFVNVTVLGAAGSEAESNLSARAWQQAKLWPRQLLGALTHLSIFGFFILLNLGLAIYLAPQMLKVLFGIETVFTRSGFSILNTTFLAALSGLVYLCFDPYVKAVFTLRCYYGESQRTGDDLRAELRGAAAAAVRRAALPALMLLAAAAPFGAAMAQETPGHAAAARVSPEELDVVLGEVIQERHYAWRMPREELGEDELFGGDAAASGSAVGRFFLWWRDLARDSLRAVGRGVEKVFEWVEKIFRPNRRMPSMPNVSFDFLSAAMKGLMWLLIAAIIGIVIWLLARLALQYQRRQRAEAEAAPGGPPAVIPDVADECVGADQLREDEWLALARDLWARGESRLALRALYLGCLAALARRELLLIARHKSNRDYERELRRRAHALPGVMENFSATMTGFERVWYGSHEATPEAYSRFEQSYERIAAHAPR